MKTEVIGNKQLISSSASINKGFLASARKAIRQKTVREAAKKMKLKTESSILSKYIKCNFSDDNSIPDFDGKNLCYNEYVNCPNRGKCTGEGVFCKIPGNLTPREMEYAVLVAKGLSDSEAAFEMKISLNTIVSHRRHIQQKLNFASKLDIVRWVVLIAPNRFLTQINL